MKKKSATKKQKRSSKKLSLNAPVINSFRKRTFIEVFCAKCNERYSNDAEYEPVFANKEEAMEVVMMDGWIIRNRAAFCENCL